MHTRPRGMHTRAPGSVRWLAAALLGLTVAACTEAVPEDPITTPAVAAPSPEDAGSSLVTVGTEAGSGTGLVLTPDGHILASIQIAADETTITFDNGDTRPATLVAADPRSGLAVIKVDGVPDPAPARFGDSDSVEDGDEVFAHPFLGASVDDAGGGGGAQVREVVAGSPAQRAGLQPGDVIAGIDDLSITRDGEGQEATRLARPGTRLSPDGGSPVARLGGRDGPPATEGNSVGALPRRSKKRVTGSSPICEDPSAAFDVSRSERPMRNPPYG